MGRPASVDMELFELMECSVKYDSDVGVVYVAFGRPFLAMALLSAKMLRESNRDIPFTIVSNVTASIENFSFFESSDRYIFISEETEDNRLIKTSINKYSNYRKTLYLDCDTQVVGSLTPIFDAMERFDLAIHLKARRYKRSPYDLEPVFNGHPANALPHWNGGVFFFNDSPEAKDFFAKWNSLFTHGGLSIDQISLAQAIYASNARVLALDARWNSALLPKDVDHDVVIYHYTSSFDDSILRDLCLMDSSVVDPVVDVELDLSEFFALRRGERHQKDLKRWRERRAAKSARRRGKFLSLFRRR